MAVHNPLPVVVPAFGAAGVFCVKSVLNGLLFKVTFQSASTAVPLKLSIVPLTNGEDPNSASSFTSASNIPCLVGSSCEVKIEIPWASPL